MSASSFVAIFFSLMAGGRFHISILLLPDKAFRNVKHLLFARFLFLCINWGTTTMCSSPWVTIVANPLCPVVFAVMWANSSSERAAWCCQRAELQCGTELLSSVYYIWIPLTCLKGSVWYFLEVTRTGAPPVWDEFKLRVKQAVTDFKSQVNCISCLLVH